MYEDLCFKVFKEL